MEITPVSDQIKGTALCWSCGGSKRILDEVQGTMTVGGQQRFVCKNCYIVHKGLFASVVDMKDAEKMIKERRAKTPIGKRVREIPMNERHKALCWLCLTMHPMDEMKMEVHTGGKPRCICRKCALEVQDRHDDGRMPIEPTFIEKFIEENRGKQDWERLANLEGLLRTKQIAALQMGRAGASEAYGCMRLLAEILVRGMKNGTPSFEAHRVDWKTVVPLTALKEDRKCPVCQGVKYHEAQDGIVVCAQCGDMYIAKPLAKEGVDYCRKCHNTELLKNAYGFMVCRACGETHPKTAAEVEENDGCPRCGHTGVYNNPEGPDNCTRCGLSFEKPLEGETDGSYCPACGGGNFSIGANGLICRACGAGYIPGSRGTRNDVGVYCPQCGEGKANISKKGLLTCSKCLNTYTLDTAARKVGGTIVKDMKSDIVMVNKEGDIKKGETSNPVALGRKGPGYGDDYRKALESTPPKSGLSETPSRTSESSSGAHWGHRTGP